LFAAEINFLGVGVRAAKKKHGGPFSRLRIHRMTKITVVFFVAAAHRDDFDLRLMELKGRAKVFLGLAEALAAFGFLGDRQ
jgi:hypothetical protein